MDLEHPATFLRDPHGTEPSSPEESPGRLAPSPPTGPVRRLPNSEKLSARSAQPGFTDPRATQATATLIFSSENQRWRGGLLNRLHLGSLRRDPYYYSNDMIAAVRSGRGALDWRCDGLAGHTTLAPGDISIQPAGRFLHSGTMAGVVCDTLNFEPGFVAAVAADDPAARNFTLRAAAGEADPLLARLIDLLADEVPRRGESSDPLAAEERLAQIAAHLVATRSTSPRTLRSYRRGLESWRLRRVLDHIENHLADRIDLPALAAAAGGVSLHHFCRLFRQSMGLPPHRYVLRRRLATARRLLAARDPDLLTVALAAGFCDHAHLTRRFRREYGVTPSAFARRR